MKSGLRAHHDDVVDDHADEVEPDRVVLVDRLGDRDLRADAVGAGREQRPRVGAQRGGVEQAGESADPAQHLGPCVRRTADFISSTARSPAAVSTPASA